jgi:hypothetical protein
MSRLSLPPAVFLLAVLLTNSGRAGADPVSPNTVIVLDTLGAATPSTVFSVFGAGGITIGGGQLAGPQFHIAAPTVITHIGTFANNCRAIGAGVPNCDSTSPFVVELYPSVGGAPDPARVLGSFTLSHDDNPLQVSFEAASMRMVLQPGSYFALFRAQGGDMGYLLTSASDPFPYLPNVTTFGVIVGSGQGVVSSQFTAVRILGDPAPVPEPATLILLSIGLAATGWRAKRRRARTSPVDGGSL